MASAPANTMTPATPVTAATPTETLPSAAALLQAARIAMKEDRPIQMDYYLDTVTGKACIGEDATRNEKVLFKNLTEFTSLIQKIFKVGTDFLVLTENSIYIVSGLIKKRGISMANLHMEE
jgi:hypothetical protein